MRQPLLFACGTATLGLLLLSVRSAQSSGQTGALVRLQSATPGVAQTGHVNVTGTAMAGSFLGGGSGLTGLNATNISTGSLADARLSSNVPLKGANNTFTGTNQFNGFVGVGRTSGPTGTESFGIGESSNWFDGMFIKTASDGSPYYGYTAGSLVAYHYLSGVNDTWSLVLDGGVPILASRNKVGINTTTLSETLNVGGSGSFQATGAPATGALSAWQYGANANAIRGTTAATSGFDAHGIVGVTASKDAAGVYGANSSSISGSGVIGRADSAGSYGVWGQSINGIGVYGVGAIQGLVGRSTAGNGLYSESQTGYSILAISASNDSIVGQTNVTGKSAFYGYAGATTANGAYFHSAAGSGTGMGVIGRTSSLTDGYGVFSFGRSGASGTKTFRIDHPLDPQNKYLIHYSSEGPEPLNIYSGTIETDSSGSAWVELPAYFSEVNRDPRVQLTVRDDSDDFVLSKVVGDVTGKGFRIRTSKPSVTVFWEVKAVRNDAFVREYGAPVEVEKPAHERGKYQHPELYGAPATMGTMYREAPKAPQGSK